MGVEFNLGNLKILVFSQFFHLEFWQKSSTNVGKIYNLSRERIRQIVESCKRPAGLMLARRSIAIVAQMLEITMIKLGGFAHIRQIAKQFAEDNAWNAQDCTQTFVEFLFEIVSNKFENHGHGYYSTLSFPCLSCHRLNVTASGMVLDTNDKSATRQNFFSILKSTCCSDCIMLPRQVPNSFLDWYMLRDHPEIVVTNDEIYLSDGKKV